MHTRWSTQVTFVLGGFFSEDVAFEGLTAFNGTTWTNAKALFSAALGLHFGHLNAPFLFVLVRRCEPIAILLAPRHLFASPFYAETDESASATGLAAPPDFFAAWRDHHDHLPPFQLGKLLNHNEVSQFIPNALQQRHSDLLMRYLSASKSQRYLAFVSIIQKALDVAHFDVVVTIVSTRSEFDFFDLDDFLFGLRFCCLFLLLVFEFAVIHETAYRRFCVGCNFYQIDIVFPSQAQGFGKANNAKRLVIGSTESYFGGHDFPIKAVFAFLALAAIAKFCNDG